MTTTNVEHQEIPEVEDSLGAKPPEEAALLGTQKQPQPEGVANPEPGAESSSPLLVRPGNERDPVSIEDKAARKKRKKLRESSVSASSRTRRSTSRKRTPAEGALTLPSQDTRKSTTRKDHRDDGSLALDREHRPSPVQRSLWGWLSDCACVRGSLQLPPSMTELPELTRDSRAAIKALDRITKKSNVEVVVRHTDNMPFLSNSISSYGHPIAVIHFLDRCTGLPIAPRQHSGQATFRSAMLNAFEWNTSLVCRSLTLSDFLAPQVVVLIEIVEPKRLTAQNRAQAEGANNQGANVSTGPPMANKDLDHDLSSEAFFKRIGWCFFKPISDRGNIRLPSLSLRDKATTRDTTMRLQLFAWCPLSWVDSFQARSKFRWNPDSGGGVPSVFLQYQRRTKSRLPCSIRIDIQPVPSNVSPKRLNPSTESGPPPTTTESESSPGGNQEINSDMAGSAVEQQASNPSAPEPLLHCKRYGSELCLVPQRVLYRLPTGRKGCSCLAFSSDGLFLAAAIHHVTSTADEWVIHIHEINTGVVWQRCRGHQNMIYSLEWGFTADGTTKTVVSASSDGSVILWQLRRASDTIDRSNPPAVLPSQVFQHVPSPVFVYCAIFHSKQPQLIVSGASDGVVRLWDIHGVLDESSGKSTRPCLATPVHEWRIYPEHSHQTAIHSIRMEARQGGRLFCGDASGTITVWSPTSVDSLRYELTKTVRTGQRSIASLALHPRKQHLLVLTHPHALFQYETRSFLLLHKNYAGIECDQLLAKAAFSPDGQYVVSGSEDGVPHVFGAAEGVRLARTTGGLWGHRFFHGFPLMEIAWSPTAHVVAMSAYGGHHPVVVLCANRDDRPLHEDARSGTHQPLRHAVTQVERGLGSPDAMPRRDRDLRNPVEDPPAGEATERVLQRRRQRLQAKLAREIDAAVSPDGPPS